MAEKYRPWTNEDASEKTSAPFSIDWILSHQPSAVPSVSSAPSSSFSETDSQRSSSVGSAEDSVGYLQWQPPVGLIQYDPPAVYYPTPILPIDVSPITTAYERVVQHLQNQEAEVKKARRSRPKKFSCSWEDCDRTFSNRGQLKGHERIHTKERPFLCPMCPRSFTRNEELTRHKRIHSGEKPFACRSCCKAFGRKDHLKKHEKIHARAFAAAARRQYVDMYRMAAAANFHQAQHPSAFQAGAYLPH